MDEKNIERKIHDSGDASLLKSLLSITKRLTGLGIMIISCLILSLLCLAVFVILNRHYDDPYRNHLFSYSFAAWIYSIVLAVLGIFQLFRFNLIKNRGLTIYEEVTEEIEWSNKRKTYLNRPSVEAKIVINSFLRSTDLPFTSGAIGQSFYFIAFLMDCIAAIVLLALI
jgi:hypothetical protein